MAAAAVDLGAREQANAAGEALSKGDLDGAVAIAEAAKKLYPTADNTLFTDLDQAITAARTAKKAKADKEVADKAKAVKAEATKKSKLATFDRDKIESELTAARRKLAAHDKIVEATKTSTEPAFKGMIVPKHTPERRIAAQDAARKLKKRIAKMESDLERAQTAVRESIEGVAGPEAGGEPTTQPVKPYAEMTDAEKDAHVLELRKQGKI